MSRATVFILLFSVPMLGHCLLPDSVKDYKDWLQVKVIEEPEFCPFQLGLGDKVRVHYRLYLEEKGGEEVKHGYSKEGGRTYSFAVGSELDKLPGLRQGMMGMCVDEIRELFVTLKDDHMRPVGVDSSAKKLVYVVELTELSKAPSLGNIAPGLSFGGEL